MKLRTMTFVLLSLTTFSQSFAFGSKKPSRSADDRPAGYEYVDPYNIVPPKALKLAIEEYDVRRRGLRNLNYLTVIDYTQHSRNERFFLIDMRTGSVSTEVVSHGVGSDGNHDGYAEAFSNTSGSKMTSLGFFTTDHTYYGSNGYSLVLDGLDSTNSRARSRAIVIHGADYVVNGASKQGRSWGCPALPRSVSDQIIDKIKGGSLVFAYQASKY